MSPAVQGRWSGHTALLQLLGGAGGPPRESHDHRWGERGGNRPAFVSQPST
jgi:hypothetical protein